MNRTKRRILGRICVLLVALSVGIGAVSPALALDETSAAQLSTASMLAEQDYESNALAIRVLVSQCADALSEDDPVKGLLDSILVLLDTGTASGESVALLLRTAIDSASEETVTYGGALTTGAGKTQEDETPSDGEPEEPAADPGDLPVEAPAEKEPFVWPETGQNGLPVFRVDAFIKTVLQETVLVDVPRDWGNNESGMALTSYSPVNDSGAISPSAGTLTISYFPADGQGDGEAFDTYTKNIESMSVTTYLEYEDITAAELPARRIDFTMSVGANQFSCETVCFYHDDTIYAIELMQGQQSEYDYFPVYNYVVDSAEVGDAQQVAEAIAEKEQLQEQPQETPAPAEPALPEEPAVPAEPAAPEETPAPAEPAAPQETAAPAEPAAPQETAPSAGLAGDMGSFQYAVNGHVYQFPTAVRELAEGDLPLNRQATIPYDFNSDADMLDGRWTEIVNTQYYYFENSLHKEMAGVTNMTGYPASAADCILTALIDTEGSYVDIVLPGDVKVGGLESDILRGFPAFAGMAMDGYASFRGNDLLYACNVRDDGCNGYVLIRNDAPFYSAVSIICENGVIREISFECLGSVRADGVFL